MAKGRARDQAKEAAWRRRLDRHAESGQSVRAWCRKHRLAKTAFYWWRRELTRRDAEKPATSFVPVHVIDGAARHGDSQIEIVLTDGRSVRITGTVNGAMLTEVLDVLERRAC